MPIWMLNIVGQVVWIIKFWRKHTKEEKRAVCEVKKEVKAGAKEGKREVVQNKRRKAVVKC